MARKLQIEFPVRVLVNENATLGPVQKLFVTATEVT